MYICLSFTYYSLRALLIYYIDLTITAFNSYRTIHRLITQTIPQLMRPSVGPRFAMMKSAAVDIFVQITPVPLVSYFLRTHFQERDYLSRGMSKLMIP